MREDPADFLGADPTDKERDITKETKEYVADKEAVCLKCGAKIPTGENLFDHECDTVGTVGLLDTQKNHYSEEFIMHDITRNKDGTFTVCGVMNIYLKSKDCQEGHSYDTMVSIDIMEENIQVDEDSTGIHFVKDGEKE